MKPTTQKQAIIMLMRKGWTDAMKALDYAGTIKLATRVSELSKHFTIEKRKKNKVSRFGHHYYYYEYRIVKDKRYQSGLNFFKVK